MRVLFSTVPSAGHLYPLVPLARALARAGHRVACATAAAFRPEVDRAGLEHLPCGPDDETLTRETAAFRAAASVLGPHHQRPMRFSGRFGRVAAPAVAPELLEIARTWRADAIVHETASLAAPLVADVLGIPSIHHAWGPIIPPAVVAAADAAVAPLWDRFGRSTDGSAGLFRGPYVDICPPALQFPAADSLRDPIVLRPDGYDAPGPDAVELPETEGPRAYVTLGTNPVFNGRDGIRRVVGALDGLGVTVVATVGRNNDPAALGALPPWAHVHPFVPQSTAFRWADLNVNHGGAGTILGAARHGRPALALPAGADQHDNAERFASAGAGLMIEASEATAEGIRSAVSRLLDEPTFRAGAGALAAQIAAMPDADEAAATLAARLR